MLLGDTDEGEKKTHWSCEPRIARIKVDVSDRGHATTYGPSESYGSKLITGASNSSLTGMRVNPRFDVLWEVSGPALLLL